MKERRQYFDVNYEITYPSGKKYKSKERVMAITKHGAEDYVRWLNKPHGGGKFTHLYANPTFEYIGEAIYPDRRTVGDY